MKLIKLISHSLVALMLIGVHLDAAKAQSDPAPIPERRIEVTQDVDFYGSDLRSIFDVTFNDCAAACIAEPACKALTYNEKKAACFPKSSVGEKTDFVGALSAEVVDVPQAVLAYARAQNEKLAFLPSHMGARALVFANKNGAKYPTNGRAFEGMVHEARVSAEQGRARRAVQFYLAALNGSDQAEIWLEVATIANRRAKENGEFRAFFRELALPAAYNAFLRAQHPQLQISALLEMSYALELAGNGRLTIPTLRLAKSISPRRDIIVALDRAETHYGLRVVNHRVDHNPAQPRVCVEFSEQLIKDSVEYSDFIQADLPDLVVEIEDQQLCLEGLSHGAQVRLTFRKGLPAVNDLELLKNVNLELYVRDRDPSVRFAGRAYVLPRREGASIPLTTVNVDQVDVQIFRVGDRNLVQTLQGQDFGKPISRWDINEFGRKTGVAVWSGVADVVRDLNKEVTTALPIGDALSTFGPGAYVLTAQIKGAKKGDVAAQWFVVSDIGISSLKGNDGIHVFARSLNTAKPLPGATVHLISKANLELGHATTDADGYASFAKGLALGKDGAEPALITVETADGDYAFLDQSAAEYDLSDRGVEGRKAPPPIDVFLATDRGAYRPGETLYTTLLARDHQTTALQDVPLTVDLRRPDGVRFSRQLAQSVGAGGATATFDLPPNAARGSWVLQVLADRNASPLLERRIVVEDFVPEKIDFDLAMAEGPFHLNDQPDLAVDARYLFGAIGAGLSLHGEVKLRVAKTFAGFEGYQFGLADEVFRTRIKSIATQETGADGTAKLALELPEVSGANKPLEMVTFIRLREGSGRPVERRITAPVLPGVPMIGVKPLFEGNVAEGTEAAFSVVAVDETGARTGLREVTWVLNRLHTRYQWYQTYGNWAYEPITRRERVASGTVDVSASDVTEIAHPVDYGEYELKLLHKGKRVTQSSTTFYAGWYASGVADNAPDLLDVAMDRGSYTVGDTAELKIESRFDGVAQVSVLSDRMIETRSIALVKGENSVNFRVSEDWGTGAYVTATAIQPMTQADGRNPSRALGLVFAKVDPGAKRLTAQFDVAAQSEPRAPLDVALTLDGLQAGQTGYVTIAAVDVGVLNMTGFKSPAPEDHYFGQRKLGMEMRDLYGRLIESHGVTGRLRSGGDSAAQPGLQSPPPSEKVLAQFSGVLTADAEGRVRTSFDIPDFNGTVRLMAVAWSQTGVGHAEQDVLVRDPVVVVAHAPRFMTPGDESRVRVELTHVDGPVGDFEVTLTNTAGLEIGQSGSQIVTLKKDAHAMLTIPLTAIFPEKSRFEVRVKTPDGRILTKSITVPVQWNDPETVRQTRVELAAGGNFQLDENTLYGFHPGTVKATLSVGAFAQFDAAGLMAALDRYPYGCTEQTTSKAMPLLYFDQLSSALGLDKRSSVKERIDFAIVQVLSNQSSSGGFGLWAPGSGDLWLDSYVTDFLSRARQQGYDVPDEAFERALRNLRNRLNYASDFEVGGEDVAYALMVSAREGYAAVGDLRYYVDTRANAFATPLAQAQLGAAVASYGDQIRADKMFRLAAAAVETQKPSDLWRQDYGSNLRDAAGVLSLAVDAGSAAVDQPKLVRWITGQPIKHRSTQENLWTLMAVNALAQNADAKDMRLDGKLLEAPLVRPVSEADLQKGLLLENGGEDEALAVVSVFGVPSEPEPASGKGYTIERSYYTLEGSEVSLGDVAQNSRLVVVIKVKPLRDTNARLMVNDPLPAGFEIENPNLISTGDLGGFEWLKLNAYPSFSEFRTDRFLSAVNWSGRKPFHLAYQVRAVSPGQFHHPAATVEDMYRPDFRARTDAGRVVVTAQE